MLWFLHRAGAPQPCASGGRSSTSYSSDWSHGLVCRHRHPSPTPSSFCSPSRCHRTPPSHPHASSISLCTTVRICLYSHSYISTTARHLILTCKQVNVFVVRCKWMWLENAKSISLFLYIIIIILSIKYQPILKWIYSTNRISWPCRMSLFFHNDCKIYSPKTPPTPTTPPAELR